MKLKDCIELAEECGLDTLEEAFSNIEIHAGNLFAYTEITKEIEELCKDISETVIPTLSEGMTLSDIPLTTVKKRKF